MSNDDGSRRVTDEPIAELIALRQGVALMTTNVAVLTEATKNLKAAIESLQKSSVPLGEYREARKSDRAEIAVVAADVADLENEMERRLVGLDRKIDATESKRVTSMRANIGTALGFMTILLAFAGLLLNRGVL